MITVYVAGPLYSSGTWHENMRRACDAAARLIEGGVHPFVPHLYSHLALHVQRTEEQWLALDRAWLLRCDALYRLTGDSRGADLEEQWAHEAGIPIYRESEGGVWGLLSDLDRGILAVAGEMVEVIA